MRWRCSLQACPALSRIITGQNVSQNHRWESKPGAPLRKSTTWLFFPASLSSITCISFRISF